MLKDLTREDWQGFLSLDPERIPKAVILRGTRNLRRRYQTHAGLFEDVLEIGSPNGLFEDIFIGRRDGVDVGYASVYGPAMASEVAHVFAVLGTRLVIQTGVCGGLADGMEAGDIVIPRHAGCGDGASACYLPGVECVAATPELVDNAMVAVGGRVPAHDGAIWTTAALLAEGDAEINAWHGSGYAAVDLETAATFAVAEHYGMQRLSILSVFDNPRHGAHLALTEHEKQEARARGEAVALELVLEMATKHG
jgi:purine-nucleoside phosphorylase